MKRLTAAIIGVLLCGSAQAGDFDVKRDMGECVEPPYGGTNCVTITYNNKLDTVNDSKAMVDQQLQSFMTLASEQELGEVKLQYSSFDLRNETAYDNSGVIYRLIGKATYVLENPVRADQFIAALKQHGYEAQNVKDLFKNSQCAMH